MRNLQLLFLLTLLGLFSCTDTPINPVEEIPDEFKDLKSIRLNPSGDTTVLVQYSNTKTVAAIGEFVVAQFDTLEVAGLLSKKTQITITYDTTYRTIDAMKLEWSSSDNSVVTVENGVVTPIGGGDADVRCRLASKQITSNSSHFNVVGLPFLSIDSPGDQLVFTSEGIVSGHVATDALLYIQGEPASFDPSGYFEQVVQLPIDGVNSVVVKATDAIVPEAFTVKTKKYTRATPETILGNWAGTASDGSDFTFTVTLSTTDPDEFDASGLYNWKVLPPLDVTRTNIPFSFKIDKYGNFVGNFSWSRSGAVADVVYRGIVSSTTGSAGTIRYDGSWDGVTLRRTSTWTATKIQ
ncbi:hypothetical protein [uncultured Imperialibacter sp.]|uniref:hypothetical protein n=1 Tax=uncultured Imperialibacter sp. TaxID=1672639 RepID=UPI0030D6FD3F|tara:strand:+ start:45783 stop:46838 length:1056 start_codon:yes stop_codon:yes gene_type:complete